MKTGFLIVNYNDFETTSILLENIKNYDCLDHIVVVDNKSKDNSFEILKKKYSSDKISIIQNESNKGYASGINFGVHYLEKVLGECNIIVSNSDIVIYREEDLLKLINEKPEDCAIIAPIIKEHEGYNHGWKIPTPMQDVILNLPFIHRYLRPKMLLYKDAYFNKTLVDVEVVSGCFFLIDGRYLKQVNYFDENTFLYYEENIIAKKLEQIHKKTIIHTEVEVFHNHSITIDKNINKANKFLELKKSQMYFQKTYNNAGWFDQLLLKLTNKISYFILYKLR